MRSPARLIGKLLSAEHVGYAAIQSVLLQNLALLANAITGLATARILGAEGRGVYAAATALPTLLGLIAVAGISDGAIVQLRRERELAAPTVILAYAAALGASALLAAGGYLVLPHIVGAHHASDVALCRAALVFLPVTALIALTRAMFLGRGRFLMANLSSFLPNLFHAMAICALTFVAALTVRSALMGLVLGYVAAFCILLPLVVREATGPARAFQHAGSGLWRFARMAAPGEILALLTGWADRLILIPLLSAHQLGLYAVSLSLAQLVTVATPATGILLSAMTQAPPGQAKALHDTSLRVSIACLGLVVLVLFPFAGKAITLAYGPQYASAGMVFEALVLRSAAVRVAAITAQLYLASNRPGLQSLFRVVEVVCAIILLLALVPSGGALGAAVALSVATFVRLGLLWLGLVTHLRMDFPRLSLNRDDVSSVRALFGPRQSDGGRTASVLPAGQRLR